MLGLEVRRMNEENLFEHRDLIIWAAGFIDGEGCISVNRQKHKDHNWFCYTLGFAVCQKQKTPLERLQRLFGGTVYSYQLNRVTYWRWFTWSKNAVAAIEKVL